MNDNFDLAEVIRHIDPGQLSYEEWCQVGMGLKAEGYPVSLWDSWSRGDIRRYHEGECEKKWAGFSGSGITGGTVVHFALEQGWSPPRPYTEDRAFDWDDVIGDGIIDPAWVEDREASAPPDWDPVKDLVTYLETIFDSEDNVGYVTSSWEKDGRFMPTKGNWDRTAGELIDALGKCGGDIGAVLGDYKPECGAWIRFNPLDGKGIKNENVSDFRYALVESDAMDIDRQNAIIRELGLPVAALVHSGGKSLHAIVKVHAKDYDEYRKRVDYLYSVCKKNGLVIDTQNKNPSRLSRLPGVTRNGNPQFLLGTNIGKESWEAWVEWYEAETDNLPDMINLSDVWDNMPDLAPELIDGILRQGHKMLLASSSKAGKSVLLMELAIAIAEGQKWLGRYCTKGKVLYVDLEIDKPTSLHRFREIYEKIGIPPENINNIVYWPLRGFAEAMDKLSPKLIRRALKDRFSAIIIDPLYKVLMGDENSAEQMAKFFNQFDKICHEVGSAVIYSHHHSKGFQGQKFSMDRASGSGVFARDPDALLDLTELHITDDIQSALKANDGDTAWKIDATLREFARPDPIFTVFNYPVHIVDKTGILADAKFKTGAESVRGGGGNLLTGEEKKERLSFERQIKAGLIRDAINSIKDDDRIPTLANIAEHIGSYEKDDVDARKVKRWIETLKEKSEAIFIVADKKDGGYVREFPLSAIS